MAHDRLRRRERRTKAVAEAAPHLQYFQANLAAGFVGPGKVWMPPGYLEAPALVQFLEDLRGQVHSARGGAGHVRGAAARDSQATSVWSRAPLIGSPETVRRRLSAYVRQLGIGTVLALLQFGSLPSDLTARSTELYAREVVPFVREELAGAGLPTSDLETAWRSIEEPARPPSGSEHGAAVSATIPEFPIKR